MRDFLRRYWASLTGYRVYPDPRAVDRRVVESRERAAFMAGYASNWPDAERAYDLWRMRDGGPDTYIAHLAAEGTRRDWERFQDAARDVKAVLDDRRRIR